MELDRKLDAMIEKLESGKSFKFPADEKFLKQLEGWWKTSNVFVYENKYTFIGLVDKFNLDFGAILRAISCLDRPANTFHLSHNHEERGLFFIVNKPNLSKKELFDDFMSCNPLAPGKGFRTMIFSGFQDSGTKQTGLLTQVTEDLKEPYKSAYKPATKGEVAKSMMESGKVRVERLKTKSDLFF